MASIVFGTPITDSTLEGMPEYAGKKIGRIDRAHVSLLMKNSGDKDVNARTYVENLKKQYGDGVSTLTVIYNATGDPITFATTNNWSGHIGHAPYPQMIENGQWGAFLHVHTSAAARGSVAAVAYHGKNAADKECDWMIFWSNPWNRASNEDNLVYTEIRGKNHFDGGGIWGVVYDKGTKVDNKTDYPHETKINKGLYCLNIWDGCKSTVATGSSTSPVVEAVFTLENA